MSWTALLSYAYVYLARYKYTVFISSIQKYSGLWYLKLILAIDEPKQKIKTINTSWSQNTPQTMLLHLKVELMLIYICIVLKSFPRHSQNVLFHLMILTKLWARLARSDAHFATEEPELYQRVKICSKLYT